MSKRTGRKATASSPAMVPVSRAEVAAAASRPLRLVAATDPVLHVAARPFAADALTSPELAALVGAMRTMLAAIPIGVGLAAPQVGLPFALCLIETGPGEVIAFANPRKVGMSALTYISDREGCLSVPGRSGVVRRSSEQTVEGHIVGVGHKRLRATGFTARIFAHELDHLTGKLYLARVVPGSLEGEAA